MPKIQGDATELHPAVVIFALVLGGAIAGLLGAILALPIAAAVRDVYVYAFRRAEGMSRRTRRSGTLARRRTPAHEASRPSPRRLPT